MNPHLVHRAATALADWASDIKLNKLSDWSAHDFTKDAEAFVKALQRSVEWHSRLGRVPTEDSYRTNVVACLEWSLSGPQHEAAINVALFELGPDLTGLEFDDE
jgi:hypothetical protein